MPTTDERLNKLNVGAALLMFDRSLRSVSNTVLYYAIVSGIVGLVLAVANWVGWVFVGIGIALTLQAIYIRRVRNPKVVLSAGITLAVFAVWLIGNFVLAILGYSKGGRGLIAGLFLAYGAWNMLTSYRNYKNLLDLADPAVSDEVRSAVNSLQQGKAEDSADIVEWKMRGMSKSGVWRLRRFDDLLLLAHFSDKTFGRGGRAQKVIWARADALRAETEGNKWIGKNLNAKLFLPNENEEVKIEISPAMMERLQKTVVGSGYLSSSFAAH